MQNEHIIVEQDYNASLDRVWIAITDSEQMKQWFFENINTFKAEVGFETQFDVQSHDKIYLHLWKVTEVQPRKKIIYNWKYGGYSGNSYVIWELSPGNNLTKLKLTHEGQETFPQDNPDFKRESCIEGWNFFICKRLKEFLETSG
ncbi:MAG: SRPBCC domain-containing protein [Bacteroidetes bacterium]|nr:SRPBCC domain-containing protein [Bacteroidota bacterium]